MAEEKFESIDLDKVDKIVNKMKKKYTEQGVEFEEVGGELEQLRGVITEREQAQIKVQTEEDLKDARNFTIKILGSLYLLLKLPLAPIKAIIKRFPIQKQLTFYLYSANMPYSAQQYLSIATIISFLSLIVSIVLTYFFLQILNLPERITMLVMLVIPLIVFFMASTSSLMYPKTMAQRRANACSMELPFALRHMATQLKAGIGLFKTIQSIATSKYGVLSEEFSRTVNEVEEGVDTKEALAHFAARTQSHSLKLALLQINRAMKSGGNLSNVMSSIAEDVSFDIRMRTRDFAEKMNFFGVLFIVLGIVFPVFIAIIAGVTNAPVGISMPALTPTMMGIIFLVMMPLILGYLILYLVVTQPKA